MKFIFKQSCIRESICFNTLSKICTLKLIYKHIYLEHAHWISGSPESRLVPSFHLNYMPLKKFEIWWVDVTAFHDAVIKVKWIAWECMFARLNGVMWRKYSQGNLRKKIFPSRMGGMHTSNDDKNLTQMSRLVEKPTMWFPNRSDTNRPVQAQKIARSLKFRI